MDTYLIDSSLASLEATWEQKKKTTAQVILLSLEDRKGKGLIKESFEAKGWETARLLSTLEVDIEERRLPEKGKKLVFIEQYDMRVLDFFSREAQDLGAAEIKYYFSGRCCAFRSRGE